MFHSVEDFERNDGTEERPYFMSKNLKKLLNVKNKFEQTDDGEGELQLEPVESSEKPS